MPEIVAEDDNGDLIVHFSKDEWRVLDRVLDDAYDRDFEMHLDERYGRGAREVFIELYEQVGSSIPGAPNISLIEAYLYERNSQDWK